MNPTDRFVTNRKCNKWTAGGTKDCPLESFRDRMGVNAKKSTDYLHAAKLIKAHRRYKTIGPVLQNWDSLISEYSLDIEVN